VLSEYSRIITISGYLPLYKENKSIDLIFFGNIIKNFNNRFQIDATLEFFNVYNIKKMLFTRENPQKIKRKVIIRVLV
jgi:hypothetical protein